MRPWTGPYLVIKTLKMTWFIKYGCTPQSKPKIVHRNRLWKYSGRDRETEDIALRRSKRVRTTTGQILSSGRRLAEQGGMCGILRDLV